MRMINQERREYIYLSYPACARPWRRRGIPPPCCAGPPCSLASGGTTLSAHRFRRRRRATAAAASPGPPAAPCAAAVPRTKAAQKNIEDDFVLRIFNGKHPGFSMRLHLHDFLCTRFSLIFYFFFLSIICLPC